MLTHIATYLMYSNIKNEKLPTYLHKLHQHCFHLNDIVDSFRQTNQIILTFIQFKNILQCDCYFSSNYFFDNGNFFEKLNIYYLQNNR